jgi:predicted transcriptional regulator
MAKEQQLTCRLDDETKAKFERAAREEKRYPSQQLRIIVEEWIEQRKGKRREFAASK